MYKLDIAVHQAMIEDKSFKDFTLPRLARAHIARLSDALQPLIDRTHERDTLKKLKGILFGIFEQAIKVRSLYLVSIQGYESIWPSSGGTFEGGVMELHRPGRSRSAPLVRLPLCPGLRAYPRERRMVSYEMFKPVEGAEVAPTYVIKALVM